MGVFTMPELEFSKDWSVMDPSSDKYFPTYEPSEEKVRADLQLLFNDIKDKWNGPLGSALKAFCDNFGGLTPRGAYSAETTYRYLDLISYQGCSYVARKRVPETGEETGFSGVAPSDDEGEDYWQLFSSNVQSSSAALNTEGSPGVSVTLTAGDNGPSLAFSFNGLGAWPLLSSTSRTILGLANYQTKIEDMVLKLPHLETGTFSLPVGITSKKFTFDPGTRILALYIVRRNVGRDDVELRDPDLDAYCLTESILCAGGRYYRTYGVGVNPDDDNFFVDENNPERSWTIPNFASGCSYKYYALLAYEEPAQVSPIETVPSE